MTKTIKRWLEDQLEDLAEAKIVRTLSTHEEEVVTYIKDLQNNADYFPILGLHRQDMEAIRLNPDKFTDEQMQSIAEQMGDQIINEGHYYDHLEAAIEYLDFNTKDKSLSK